MQSYTHTYLKIWRLFDVPKMSVRARSSAMLDDLHANPSFIILVIGAFGASNELYT